MGAETSTEQGGADAQPPQSGPPIVLVVCGPSGAGKSTLIDLLMEDSEGFAFCVSHTTRKPRGAEKNGVHYFFCDEDTFRKGLSEGRFLEHATVHSHLYGSSKDAVNSVLNSGKCCILDIDVQGARQIRESGVKAIFVFISPPSDEELEKRLRARGTDSEEQIEMRLRNAKLETECLREPKLFDFCIVNGDLSESYSQLKAIATKARQGLMPDPMEVKPLSQLRGTSHERQSTQDSLDLPSSTVNASGQMEPPIAGMEKWRGKVAVVTGASSRFGWAICEALAGAGMRVVAVARGREHLEKLQQSLIAQGVPAQDFLPVVCDISKDVEVNALPRIVSKRWPESVGVDVLINNAGLSRENSSLVDGTTEMWVDMLATNVLGLSMCSREVVKRMKLRDEWGYIINVTALTEQQATEHLDGHGRFYEATRKTVEALTEGLRSEVQALKYPLKLSCISSSHEQANGVINPKPSTPNGIAQSVIWLLSAPDHVEANHVSIQ